MIRILQYNDPRVGVFIRRENAVPADVERDVAAVIANVRQNGDKAVLGYAKQFDKAELTSLRVTDEEFAEALASTPQAHLDALKYAAENIRNFHGRQKREGFVCTGRDGVVLGQRVTPIDRVGIYAPGGTASYPSSLLMNAIPAKVAGCPEIYISTPPQPDGKILPAMLAAAQLAGVTTVFKAGGAVAVAAFAYGTESIPQVDKVVGPGGIYVATAKRMVFGQVGIEMIAGPSDVLVLADAGGSPAHIAADMLAQAEHDAYASAVLVTDSAGLAEKVAVEIEKQLKTLPRERIARQSIDQNSLIAVVPDMKTGLELSNKIAPEHLEICLDEPFALLPLVRNAGSVFLGKNVPEALGDFVAGVNHTLPTLGTARFSSPLGVDDFMKRSSFVYYSSAALQKDEKYTSAFAEMEGLAGHGRSVTIRKEGDKA